MAPFLAGNLKIGLYLSASPSAPDSSQEPQAFVPMVTPGDSLTLAISQAFVPGIKVSVAWLSHTGPTLLLLLTVTLLKALVEVTLHVPIALEPLLQATL